VSTCLTRHGVRLDFDSETFVTHSLRGEGFDVSEDGTGRGTPLMPVLDLSYQKPLPGETSNAYWERMTRHEREHGITPEMLSRGAGPTAFAATDYESGAFDQVEQAAPLTTSADRTRAAPILAFSAKDHGADVQEDLSPTLRAGGHAGSHANAGVMPAIAFKSGQSEAAGGTFVTEEFAPTLQGQNNGSTAVPAVAVALRGRDGGATAELGDETSNALRASSGGGDKAHVLAAMQVRRLTPVECARLQGFPDHYLDITYRGKPAADGPKYKALGNSWAVPNVRWIGRRIDAVRAWSPTEPQHLGG
jgi:DNA (cytosine-5)-methyltransferase 1